jgi:hypothetical protein
MDSIVFLALLHGEWSSGKGVEAGTPFPSSSTPVDSPWYSNGFRVDEEKLCILQSNRTRKTGKLPPSHAHKHASGAALREV